MTLDDLKALCCAASEFQWCGRTIYLRKLSAKDHFALFDSVKADEAKDLSPDEDRNAVLRHHVELASRTLAASPSGELVADSDEGREALARLPFDDLVQLGRLVLSHSGYDVHAEKKSLATSNDSASSFAAN